MELQERALQLYYIIRRYNGMLYYIDNDTYKDCIQFCVLAVLEDPDRQGQLKRAKNYIYGFLLGRKEVLFGDEIEPEEQNDNDDRLRKILEYYTEHTYQETCFHFGLENTPKLRKLLSECCPKPEKSAKKYSKYRKTSDPKEAVTKVQRFKLRKKGYIYIPIKKETT